MFLQLQMQILVVAAEEHVAGQKSMWEDAEVPKDCQSLGEPREDVAAREEKK